MSDSLKTEKASVKEVPLKFHDITKDEIPEVVKLVEDIMRATFTLSTTKKSQKRTSR